MSLLAVGLAAASMYEFPSGPVAIDPQRALLMILSVVCGGTGWLLHVRPKLDLLVTNGVLLWLIAVLIAVWSRTLITYVTAFTMTPLITTWVWLAGDMVKYENTGNYFMVTRSSFYGIVRCIGVFAERSAPHTFRSLGRLLPAVVSTGETFIMITVGVDVFYKFPTNSVDFGIYASWKFIVFLLMPILEMQLMRLMGVQHAWA